MSSFTDWFWQEKFWLPERTSWSDLRDRPGAQFAQPHHLYLVLPYAVSLYLLRLFVELVIAKPLGLWLNISNAAAKPPSPNVLLERVYGTITKNPQGERLKGLCKQLDWNEKKVHRWFKRKRDINRPSQLVKFQETVWRFLLYTFLFVLGNVTLYKTSPQCLSTPSTCWKGYPEKQQLNSYNYIYFQTELAFYTSCAISQFFDVKRKDFWVMFLHHIATIFLIAFSYSINMLNIGAVIMVLHDFSDIFLETSKMIKYAKFDQLAVYGFISFGLSFFLARIIYFPFWVLHSVYYDAFEVAGYFPSFYFFCIWLVALQILHVYWVSFIFKGLIDFIKNGGGDVGDARSDSEASDSENEDKTK